MFLIIWFYIIFKKISTVYKGTCKQLDNETLAKKDKPINAYTPKQFGISPTHTLSSQQLTVAVPFRYQPELQAYVVTEP